MADEPQLGPIKLAFIIDNKVVDLLHTDERFKAVFMSNPLILDVTNIEDTPGQYVMVGSTYDPETGNFLYSSGE
jgi:hypothetical protein